MCSLTLQMGPCIRRNPISEGLNWRSLQLEVWIVMNAIFILLAVSAILGLLLGFYLSWNAILVSGFVLAFLSATILQNEGFGFLAGIAIIIVCLVVNQVAYLIGTKLVTRGAQDPLPHGRLNDDPGEDSHNDIAGEHKRDEQPPIQFGPRGLRQKSDGAL
jgi:hypothetical protein